MHGASLDLFFIRHDNRFKIERVVQHDYSSEFIRFWRSRNVQQPIVENYTVTFLLEILHHLIKVGNTSGERRTREQRDSILGW